MNVYSLITIELVKNNFTYRFEIPFGAAYADAEQVALDMAKQVAEMARVAMENAQKSEQIVPEENSPEAPCSEPCVESELVSE